MLTPMPIPETFIKTTLDYRNHRTETEFQTDNLTQIETIFQGTIKSLLAFIPPDRVMDIVSDVIDQLQAVI